MVMQDWWWCVRCDRIESGVWNVVGVWDVGDGVVIVSDVYPSLACRIPTHVALYHFQKPLAPAISSLWHHLLHCKSFC